MNEAVLLFCIIIAVNQWWTIKLLLDIRDGRIQGTPALRVMGKAYNMVVSSVRARRIRNQGDIKSIRDTDQQLERRFAAQILQMTEWDFTEERLYPVWQKCGGGSKESMRDCLSRWEGQGVLGRKNDNAKNSTRVLKSYALLKGKAKQ